MKKGDLKLKITNIVVVSRKYKQLEKMIVAKNLPNHFRFLPEEEVTEEDLRWADAIVSFNTKTQFDYSHVKWVHSLGAGVDSLLFKKEWNTDVLLTRTICSFGQRIAEYCLSYILKDLQYHDQFQQAKAHKKWEPITPKLLSDQKIMIYGTGEIGQKTAQLFSSFGVDVYGVSLSGKQKDYFKEVISINDHLAQLSDIDYVINTLPLTESTDKLFNDEFFKRVSNIGFLNVGRGKSIDEQALLHALNDDHVRFAVLDVFAIEPLPEDNPLWSHPNVAITPHISAVTTPNEGVDCFVETLKNIEANKPLHNKVDVNKGY
jgi:glyoxylate/hydroxypyruvate reductase